MRTYREHDEKNRELVSDLFEPFDLWLAATVDEWAKYRIKKDFNWKYTSDENEKAFYIAGNLYKYKYFHKICSIRTAAIIGLFASKWDSIDKKTRKQILSKTYYKNERLGNIVSVKEIEEYISIYNADKKYKERVELQKENNELKDEIDEFRVEDLKQKKDEWIEENRILLQDNERLETVINEQKKIIEELQIQLKRSEINLDKDIDEPVR